MTAHAETDYWHTERSTDQMCALGAGDARAGSIPVHPQNYWYMLGYESDARS